ncbi:MAG: PilN domain-containing protein [Rhodoferax sp.]|nr:PilN domain-containing protein [Rhodoferax sp.]
MPQQINLCSPVLLAPKRYFAADTMLRVVGLFAVVGGIGCAAYVWYFSQASAELQRVLQNHKQQATQLQAALTVQTAAAAPLDPTLQSQRKALEDDVARQEGILRGLEQGRMVPGEAHSDRLALVSRSIPEKVWVTGLLADATRLEVTGYTLEPSALNDWVARLSLSPLMQGLRLATVKVQSTRAPQSPGATATVATPAAPAGPETWSFTLISAQPAAPALASGKEAKP